MIVNEYGERDYGNMPTEIPKAKLTLLVRHMDTYGYLNGGKFAEAAVEILNRQMMR